LNFASNLQFKDKKAVPVNFFVLNLVSSLLGSGPLFSFFTHHVFKDIIFYVDSICCCSVASFFSSLFWLRISEPGEPEHPGPDLHVRHSGAEALRLSGTFRDSFNNFVASLHVAEPKIFFVGYISTEL
jgi:hypothetical protein